MAGAGLPGGRRGRWEGTGLGCSLTARRSQLSFWGSRAKLPAGRATNALSSLTSVV